MQIDDLKNPEYRKGRRQPATKPPAERIPPPPPLTAEEERARFATKVARDAFGRFYWNGDLARRIERELAKSRWRQREEAELRRCRIVASRNRN